MRSDWLPLLGRWTLSAPLIAVVDVESLRVIAETFHAAKKLIEEDVLIIDTKLDKYETWSVFAAAFCNHKCTNSHTRFAQHSKADRWMESTDDCKLWVKGCVFFKHPINPRNPIYFKSFFFKSAQNAPRSKSNPDLLRGIRETSDCTVRFL